MCSSVFFYVFYVFFFFFFYVFFYVFFYAVFCVFLHVFLYVFFYVLFCVFFCVFFYAVFCVFFYVFFFVPFYVFYVVFCVFLHFFFYVFLFVFFCVFLYVFFYVFFCFFFCAFFYVFFCVFFHVFLYVFFCVFFYVASFLLTSACCDLSVFPKATAAKRQAAADPATPATEVLEPATPATPAPFLPRPAGDGGFEDKCVVRTQPFPGGITYSTQNIEMRVTKTGYGHSQDAIIVHLAHFQDRLESALPSHAEKYDGKLDFATLEAQYKIKDKVRCRAAPITRMLFPPSKRTCGVGASSSVGTGGPLPRDPPGEHRREVGAPKPKAYHGRNNCVGAKLA